MRGSKARILLIAGALIVLVLALLIPRMPESAAESVDKTPVSDAEKELMAAVQQVQSGENPMEGILRIRALVEADSTFEEAHLWLGAFSLQSGQRDKAAERFERVIRLNPANPEPQWQLAMMAIEEENYERAIPYLMKSVELDSAYVNGLFFAARCYEETGDPQTALQLYRDYLPYAPDTVVSKRVNEFISTIEQSLN